MKTKLRNTQRCREAINCLSGSGGQVGEDVLLVTGDRKCPARQHPDRRQGGRAIGFQLLQVPEAVQIYPAEADGGLLNNGLPYGGGLAGPAAGGTTPSGGAVTGAGPPPVAGLTADGKVRLTPDGLQGFCWVCCAGYAFGVANTMMSLYGCEHRSAVVGGNLAAGMGCDVSIADSIYNFLGGRFVCISRLPLAEIVHSNHLIALRLMMVHCLGCFRPTS